MFTALLGPNGAGKSPCCRSSPDCFPRTLEACVVAGTASRRPFRALAALGIVFQQPSLDLDLTRGEKSRYYCGLHGLAGPARATLSAERSPCSAGMERGARRPQACPGERAARSNWPRPDGSASVLLLDEATQGSIPRAARNSCRMSANSRGRRGLPCSGPPISCRKSRRPTASSCSTVAASAPMARPPRSSEQAGCRHARGRFPGARRACAPRRDAMSAPARPAARGRRVPPLMPLQRWWRSCAARRSVSSPDRPAAVSGRAAQPVAGGLRAGFHDVLGVSVTPPYDSYVTYDVYILPG